MALSDIATITITRSSAAVTQQGFSTPLICAYHTRWTSDRVRSYGTIDEVTADGFTPDDAVYKIASALWSQPNPPAAVKVGRRANAFTKSIRLAPTAANATEYALAVGELAASFTSDATATVAEITAGLTAAVNGLADADAIVAAIATAGTEQTLTGAELDGAVGHRAISPSRRLFFTLSNHADFDAGTAVVTGKDAAGETLTESFTIPNGGNATVTGSALFARVTQVVFPAGSGTGGSWQLGVAAPMTASDGTTHVDLAAPAGLLPSVEVTGAGVLSLEDRTANPGIAADLTAIRAEDDDWYCLLLDSNSSAEILAAAAIVEALSPRKILVAQSADTGCTDADSITDVMYSAKDADYYRTHILYHPAVGQDWIAGAMVGSALAYDPGSVTWANRELVGITDWSPTSAERSAILGKNGASLETIAGRKVTFGAKVAGGEWVDIVHGLDWLHARIGERIFGLIVSAADRKIGFTDKGIARVHAELRAQLREASLDPYNLLNEGFTTSVPTAASLSSVQRATRALPNVTFNATVQGAIHAVTVTGTVAD